MNCKPKKAIRRKVKPKKSRVLWRSGRVIKKGPDMRELRKQLFARSDGYCEAKTMWASMLGVSEVSCNRRIFENTFEMHHIKHRSRGGSDILDNLLALCGQCHRKAHGQ